jgi:hypothetical protein
MYQNPWGFEGIPHSESGTLVWLRNVKAEYFLAPAGRNGSFPRDILQDLEGNLGAHGFLFV